MHQHGVAATAGAVMAGNIASPRPPARGAITCDYAAIRSEATLAAPRRRASRGDGHPRRGEIRADMCSARRGQRQGHCDAAFCITLTPDREPGVRTHAYLRVAVDR